MVHHIKWDWIWVTRPLRYESSSHLCLCTLASDQPLHPSSRAFLLLARFWRSRERLCMNRIRSLLNMRCMLPGYSLVPKPNMPDLAAIVVFHGTAGSIITIGFVTKRTLALEKPVWREKTRLTSPEARAAAASKSWRDSGRTSFSPPQYL